MDSAYHDKDLFDLIAQGDEAAFTAIFHRYNRRLFHKITSITKSETEAEEIIQELFLRLWLNRYKLSAIENPGGWLHTVAANLSLDALRKKARTFTYAHSSEEDDPEDTLQPAAQFELKEVQGLITEAIDKLPSSRKKVFMLSRTQGLTRKEIAQQLGVSESTVKNQLTSALQFVQDYLKSRGGLYLPSLLILNF